MSVYRPLTAIGAGITVFLGVVVGLIELLPFEFSAIVGLPIGLLAGIVTAVGILRDAGDRSLSIWVGVSALAGFGYGVIAILAANYVNVVDTQFEATLAVGAVAGVLAVVLTVVADRRSRGGRSR
jgi:hypothetical protein